MERKQELLQASRNIIQEGEKVSARKLSQEMDWIEEDVHRCLNALEKEGLVETRAKEILGRKIRMVSVFR